MLRFLELDGGGIGEIGGAGDKARLSKLCRPSLCAAAAYYLYLHLGISLLNARNRRTKAGAAHTKDGGVADDAKSCLCQERPFPNTG